MIYSNTVDLSSKAGNFSSGMVLFHSVKIRIDRMDAKALIIAQYLLMKSIEKWGKEDSSGLSPPFSSKLEVDGGHSFRTLLFGQVAVAPRLTDSPSMA